MYDMQCSVGATHCGGFRAETIYEMGWSNGGGNLRKRFTLYGNNNVHAGDWQATQNLPLFLLGAKVSQSVLMTNQCSIPSSRLLYNALGLRRPTDRHSRGGPDIKQGLAQGVDDDDGIRQTR